MQFKISMILTVADKTPVIGSLSLKLSLIDNISRILWYSDWLHNTTSAGNSIFVTNHNTTSCGRSIMQPIRLPENMRNDMWRLTF